MTECVLIKDLGVSLSLSLCLSGCDYDSMSWCLMSSDVSWHIMDKLWPMPKLGSVIQTDQDGHLNSHTAPELCCDRWWSDA